MQVEKTWRLIALTAAMSTLIWLASIFMLRAVAQEVPTSGTTVGSDAGSNEEQTERRAVTPVPSSEEAPEFRESADNNISFPVDI